MTSVSTLRRLALVFGLALTLTSAAACGGDDGGGSTDAVVGGCERLDECNALAAGISADECIEMIDTSLEQATPSQRADWETLMSGCLQFETCSAFIQCVDANDL
jgi:hypothetical protein